MLPRILVPQKTPSFLLPMKDILFNNITVTIATSKVLLQLFLLMRRTQTLQAESHHWGFGVLPSM
jgi:hypothetical protein